MDEKAMARELMIKLMETTLKRAPQNVPQPMPLIEEKAQSRLSSDDLISWKLMLTEWQKVSSKGKKEIAKLLVLNSCTILEALDFHKGLTEETKDTVDYLATHPEYRKSEEEIKAESICDNPFEDMLKKLGLDD